MRRFVIAFVLSVVGLSCMGSPQRHLWVGVCTLTPNFLADPVAFQQCGNTVALLSGTLGRLDVNEQSETVATGVEDVQAALTCPNVFLLGGFVWATPAHHELWWRIVNGMDIARKMPGSWTADEPFNPDVPPGPGMGAEMWPATLRDRARYAGDRRPVYVDVWGGETNAQLDSILAVAGMLGANDYRLPWTVANSTACVKWVAGDRPVLAFAPGDPTMTWVVGGRHMLDTVGDAWYYFATCLAHGSSGVLWYTNLPADHEYSRLGVLAEWWGELAANPEVAWTITHGDEVRVKLTTDGVNTVRDYRVPQSACGAYRYEATPDHRTYLGEDVVAKAWSWDWKTVGVVANDGSVGHYVQVGVGTGTKTLYLGPHEGRVVEW